MSSPAIFLGLCSVINPDSLTPEKMRLGWERFAEQKSFTPWSGVFIPGGPCTVPPLVMRPPLPVFSLFCALQPELSFVKAHLILAALHIFSDLTSLVSLSGFEPCPPLSLIKFCLSTPTTVLFSSFTLL